MIQKIHFMDLYSSITGLYLITAFFLTIYLVSGVLYN